MATVKITRGCTVLFVCQGLFAGCTASGTSRPAPTTSKLQVSSFCVLPQGTRTSRLTTPMTSGMLLYRATAAWWHGHSRKSLPLRLLVCATCSTDVLGGGHSVSESPTWDRHACRSAWHRAGHHPFVLTGQSPSHGMRAQSPGKPSIAATADAKDWKSSHLMLLHSCISGAPANGNTHHPMTTQHQSRSYAAQPERQRGLRFQGKEVVGVPLQGAHVLHKSGGCAPRAGRCPPRGWQQGREQPTAHGAVHVVWRCEILVRGGRRVAQEGVPEMGTQQHHQTGGGATQTHKTREPHQGGQGRAHQTRSRGGGKLRSAIFRNFPQFRNFSQFSAIFRNFPQFSAIFPQFFTLPDFLTASPRWCRTMRIFVFCYSIHSQMLQSPQNLA